MQRRNVLRATGAGRSAKRSGILRAAPPGSPTSLVIESESGSQTPVIVLAPHRINTEGALLADADGTLVAWEGDRVTLVGGFAPDADPRHPAFLANTVTAEG